MSCLLALVLVVSASAAFAGVTTTTTGGYPPTTAAPTTTTTPLGTQATATTIDPSLLNAGASQGLPRTGSSSSIPTAAIAAGMVAVGSVLVVAARRRNATRRS